MLVGFSTGAIQTDDQTGFHGEFDSHIFMESQAGEDASAASLTRRRQYRRVVTMNKPADDTMAKIRIACIYGAPKANESMAKLNSSLHPPHALIDGRETQLNWSEPTEMSIASEQTHKLAVYFKVFDVLRVCGAELEFEPIRKGEVRSYEYRVELRDRYLNRGYLARVDKQ